MLPSGAPEPGPWRTDRFPLLRGVLDAFTDPAIREIVLWGPTQSGKTEMLLNALGYVIHYDPSPTLVLYPVEDTAREFATTRVEPMLNACPALQERNRVGTARTHRKAILSKTFPGMTLELRGTNSPSSLASRSCRYVFLDELDRMPTDVGGEGSPAHLARQRAQTFWNRKIVFSSTCTVAGASAIEAEYDASDRRRYWVPCLSCGYMQVLEWEQLKWDDAKDPGEARRRVRYECAKCGHAHYDKDKPRLLAGGEWRAERPGGDRAGFWWSALYSPWVGFGDLAAEWRQIRESEDDDALKVYVNCRQARTWRVKSEAPAVNVLENCIDRGRSRGTLPPWAVLLTAGADVQKHVVYFVVRAWGAQGRSALVSEGMFERESDSLDMLDDALQADYGGMPVRYCLLDSGWDPESVYAYCLRHRNCAPSKGVPVERDYTVKASEIGKRPDGREYPRGFTLWLVNSNQIRGHIHDRIGIAAGEPREWRIHADVEREYLRHLLAKERIEKHARGRSVVEWRDVRKDDHWLDAEIYAFAATKLPMVAPLLVARKPAVARPVVTGETRREPVRRAY